MSKKHGIIPSFGYALEGIRAAFKNEPNFRIHLFFAIFSLLAATVVGFSVTEWIILAFTITFVLVLELINTTLEAIVDLASPKIKGKAKIAKDVSAAAVLVSAILAIIVGLVLFIPKLL
jgi:diacylglycerol kinase